MAETRDPMNAFRELPPTELMTRLETLRNELWHARVKATEGALQQTHRLRELRRQIAQIHTVLAEQSPRKKVEGGRLKVEGTTG